MGLPIQKPASNDHLPVVAPWLYGTVVACLSRDRVKVLRNGQEQTIAVATHLPLLMPGQNVLVAYIEGGPNLVVAAFPVTDESENNADQTERQELVQFDAATGTLSIQATQLKLRGIGLVELHCGDAVLRLNAQGEIFSQAQAITQAAIGPHRIEGASVDIN